ncbi:heme-binding domain-containing protein [Nitratifractor sp.]
MKTLKVMLAWLAAGLLLIQFIRINVPPAPKAKPDDEIQAPPKIMAVLKRSCYDCHSNHTKWPWYSHVAPISYEVRMHVKEGRKWLNFSIWNQYDETKKQKLYRSIVKAIDWKMPPPDYMWIHKTARLSPEDRKMIKAWAQSHIRSTE